MIVMINKHRYFSLIELLIVIGIIGALVSLILPSFSVSEVEAKAIVNNKEFMIIQKSFSNFYDDVIPSEDDLATFAEFGLTALMENSRPNNQEKYFSIWDQNRHKGWRGPYLAPEGRVLVNVVENAGQTIKSATTKIPVIYSAYHKAGAIDSYFYRVKIPTTKSAPFTDLPNYLCLIDPGINGAIDMTALQADTATGELIITNQGDDIVVRLLPFVN